MATLRQLIDGSKDVFAVTLAAHQDRVHQKQHKKERKQHRVERVESSMQRTQAVEVNQYVYAVAISGERLQQEYQRGYHDGYENGVQAGASRVRIRESESAPKVRVLQSEREVDLEE